MLKRLKISMLDVVSIFVVVVVVVCAHMVALIECKKGCLLYRYAYMQWIDLI